MISWDGMLGLYQKALSIREEQIGLVSSNLVNQDTPGYKARDVDFKSIMAEATDFDSPLALKSNNTVSITSNKSETPFPIQYRHITSPSADGNTVDSNVEKTEFMSDVVRYKSTLAFIESRKAALMTVLKGE